MQATLKTENGVFVIAPEGRLDTVNSAELRAQIDSEDAAGLDIDFDLAGVDYISSAGLRLLVALQKQVNGQGKTLTLRNPNKVVSEVFRVAGVGKVFKIL
ncbi:MAG: STAS domain-containing protein [Clostridia bacterium]|nr:STAS domain-containing protein [Clostridia bacterium]